MSTSLTSLTRRTLIGGAAVAAGGLAVGIALPFAGRAQSADKPAAAPDEVNAWVVIKPDDTVVIRIARSEMGQGSLTGLAQLVAEELDCDWGKVSTEFVSPNEHIKRKRIWGSMSTGGSAGVRTSQEYLRKSGASARTML